jgi:hypothetical protein
MELVTVHTVGNWCGDNIAIIFILYYFPLVINEMMMTA